MHDKIILITGGSRGLGADFVETMSATGNNIVYYTYSTAPGPLPAHAPERVYPIRCDQRNEEEILGCVSKVIGARGRIDALVNNACSGFAPCDFLATDWDQFRDIIDVNVKGSYIFAREASRAMKEQGGGKIINILSSYVTNVPPEKLSFYITAKYALLGLSRAMAAELSKYGVTVNMISPGLMATDLSSYLPAKYLQAYSQKHPMRRMTKTSDVAAVLEFLVSDGSNFLNGVNIAVNGGETFNG